MTEKDDRSITCHALRVKQSPEHHVYVFALRAEQVHQIADVARLTRNDRGKLEGYQRSIAKDHVDNIAAYLDTVGALLPNAIILALPSSVRFDERRGPGNDDGAAIAGRLTIPLPWPNEPKPGWIVDGQQRSTALTKIKNKAFPVPIAAFVADTVDVQRDQFIRINSVHPLDKGLVTELLPEVAVPISPRLSARKVPSALVDLLATSEESPFVGLIRRPSTPAEHRRTAVVQDTSLVNAIEESLVKSTSGCLFPYRNVATGETDVEAIWWILVTYWSAVRDVFPDAWGRPPTESRLMHGVGIRAMGRLMDRVMGSIDPFDDKARKHLHRELAILAPYCHWTSGRWEELGGVEWNDLQNTPKHIRVLSNHLIRLYLRHRAGSP